MATNAKTSPQKKGGASNNSIAYAPMPREAFKEPVQPSNGGLTKAGQGTDPEKGTSGIC
jgi:hypothetical protein